MSSSDIEQQPGFVDRTLGFGKALGLVFSAYVIWSISYLTLDEALARLIAITFAFAIVLFSMPLARSLPPRHAWLGWLVDGALVVAFAYAIYVFLAVKETLWTGFYIPNPQNIFAGLLGLVAVLETTRRAWGMSLIVLAVIFVAFGFLGPFLPGFLQNFGMDLGNFLKVSWYSFDGVFGRTTGLVVDTVLIFLIFGALLERTGAGESLIKLSTALTARLPGGAAHAAIAASAVFGMMSGSVAANIAGTGVFTIPMIKRQGFSPKFAAAVETAASSGGQLTPPIMAAAAFVMAGLVGVSYATVVIAAILPAFFKYASLFGQVYGEAMRLGLKPLPEDEIPRITRNDLSEIALIVLPILALMAAFLVGYSPSMAGLFGCIVAILTGFAFNPTFRREPVRILSALAAGGISSAQIIVAVAVIGIVLAVVNETGIAIRMATEITSLGESNLLMALVLSMVCSLILGMGLPTLAAYLIVAIMIAPAIIQAGVDPLAAHLFILYFAVYSSLVPPIAYGCYVAAPIAGANPLATSFTAMRISVVGLLVPYFFVFSPSLLLVVDGFNWPGLIMVVLRLSAAIWMFSAAFAGHDPVNGKLSPWLRGVMILLAAATVVDLPQVWAPALIAFVGLELTLALRTPASSTPAQPQSKRNMTK